MESVEMNRDLLGSIKSFEERAELILREVPVLTLKISKAADLNSSQVPSLFSEVLKFLHLIGQRNQRLTPSLLVDLAWHEFILCTRHYHSYCQEQFDRYIHHHPGGDEKQNNEQFLLTHQFYQETFGTPPENFWGKIQQANCGVCEAI